MKPTVLLYHDVVPGGELESSGFQGPDANVYKLDCDEFRRHLEAIARHARSEPRGVAEAVAGGGRPLLLTFDDGGRSAAATAAMLGERNWPAHFFITTDRIGSHGFLDEAGIRRLRSAGHTIGTHSRSHPARMSRCAAADLDAEWRSSVARLEDVLGERVTTGSVPGGHYSRRVAAAAAAAGLKVLFTSEPVTSVHEVRGCLVVGRFSVRRGTTPEWVGAVVEGRLRPRLASYLFWNIKKVLKAAGGETWLAARKRVLARRAELKGRGAGR